MGPDDTAAEAEARRLLHTLDALALERFTIVGQYLRFDERTRGPLKDLRQRILATYAAHSGGPRTFLLWGAPGSGKSFLVQQVAAALPAGVQYREINLAELDEAGFRSRLDTVAALDAPVLCLIDEIDAKPGAAWPYELLLPHLEPSGPRPHRVAYCLAGSGGRDAAEFRARLAARPKGADLLSRVAAGHEFEVPALGPGDKILVAAVQLIASATAEGRPVREIEKLGLYYIATHPTFSSARQLRALAAHTAQRIPAGEDRIRFDDLFPAGDPENKRFWERSGPVRAGLVDVFLHVDPGGVLGGPAPVPSAPAPLAVAAPAAGFGPEANRIIVLPFANFSPDPADAFFADGMTEELIERLAHVAGLRVIARTTAMAYKRRTDTALEIGRALHVGSVVECSVRKSGRQLRVTAQLIDARTEEHLWSSRYDREIGEIFALQDDLAEQIATSLVAHVPGLGGRRGPPLPPTAPDTDDLPAYTLYLQARRLWQEKSSAATVRHALSLFEEAVRRDPKFARARVGIAETILWLLTEGAEAYATGVARVEEELRRALALQEGLAEAHSALASLWIGEDDVAGAEREARRALELNPSLADPYRWLAHIEAGRGRIDEAVRLLETAMGIDPADINVVSFLGRAYYYAGRDEDALRHWDRTEMLAPYRTAAHRTEYYLARGELDRAADGVAVLERLRPDSVWTLTYRGILAARTGDPEAARRDLAGLQQREADGSVTGLFQGLVHFALGEQDAFVAAMERAFATHSLPFLELQYAPLFAAARSDPRVADLLRRQREYSPPAPRSP